MTNCYGATVGLAKGSSTQFSTSVYAFPQDSFSVFQPEKVERQPSLIQALAKVRFLTKVNPARCLKLSS